MRSKYTQDLSDQLEATLEVAQAKKEILEDLPADATEVQRAIAPVIVGYAELLRTKQRTDLTEDQKRARNVAFGLMAVEGILEYATKNLAKDKLDEAKLGSALFGEPGREDPNEKDIV